MSKIFKYYTIISFLFRTFDLITTYIGSPDLSHESNPAYVYFRNNLHLGGWWVLLIYSFLLYIVGLIALYYLLKYRGKPFMNVVPVASLKEFIMVFIYGQKVSFIQTFYKLPKNPGIALLFLLSIPITASPANLWAGISNLVFAYGIWHPPSIKIMPFVWIVLVVVGLLALYMFFYILWRDYRKSMGRIEQK